jgi:hypothetical protein
MTAERAARLEASAEWEAQLARLAAYKARHGDCNVPQRWAEDLRLGRWVDSQRTRKKKLDRGEPCHEMTVERAARLEALGFAWGGTKASAARSRAANPRSAARSRAANPRPEWEAQLARLAAYKAAHGDCNVPKRWAEDLRLGRWVDSQRTGKKALDRGEDSRGMTSERAARLEALGFAWVVRQVQNQRKRKKKTADAAVASTQRKRKRRAPEGGGGGGGGGGG